MNQMIIYRIQLLTIGGLELWEEDSSLDMEESILKPNGIVLRSPPVCMNELSLCEVDPNQTDLSDFYKWDELDKPDHETFCWRTFYRMESRQNGWMSMPTNERSGSYSWKQILDLILAQCVK